MSGTDANDYTFLNKLRLQGSVGVDWASVDPTAPATGLTVGQTWVFNGATLTLVRIIPVNRARIAVEVNNTSGSPIAMVLDDGSNGNLSIYPLAATSAFAQGGAWASSVEQGRIRIFAAAANSFVYAREN